MTEPRTYSLTPAARSLLAYLRGHSEAHGIAPSYAEMAASQGLRSKSGVHRLIGQLEERGYLRRLHNRPRCIELCEPSTAVFLPAGLYAALAADAKLCGQSLDQHLADAVRAFAPVQQPTLGREVGRIFAGASA